MNDLRRLAEAAKAYPFNTHRERDLARACSPDRILKLLEVVDKARIAMESNDGDAMGFFGKLADLRTALQALEK